MGFISYMLTHTPWDLNLILTRLMGPPFKPLISCSFSQLFSKSMFLLVLTYVSRVADLKALMMGPPYVVFYKHKVPLRPHPNFLAEVVLDFHLNQLIHLQKFFQKPHNHKVENTSHTRWVTLSILIGLRSKRVYIISRRECEIRKFLHRDFRNGSLFASGLIMIWQMKPLQKDSSSFHHRSGYLCNIFN